MNVEIRKLYTLIWHHHFENSLWNKQKRTFLSKIFLIFSRSSSVAVRFGRVPKREKARILAAMQQSTQNRGHQRAMATELDDQPRLLAAVLRAHMETCEFTREKVASMRQRARDCPSYSLPTMVSFHIFFIPFRFNHMYCW